VALSANQRRIAQQIIQIGKRQGATRKQIKAALAAGQVESNLTNTPGGDRDSVGVFQIRSGIHGPIGGSVRKSAKWFYKNAKSADKGQSSGQLAQDVERSAFPDKYGQRDIQRTAGKLLRQYGGGSSGGSSRKSTRTIPGLDNSDARKSLLMDYLSRRNDPSALLTLGAGLKDAQDTPDRTVTTRTRGKAKGPTSDGRLRDPRKGGLVQFGRQLQKQGASVREHPAFDKVDPVHVQGSEHYKRRAIDVPVSDKAQGDKIAQRARKRGFDVLWQVSGHYGHVHISKPGGLK